MNDGNIWYYLEAEMATLKERIKSLNVNIESHLRRIDDIHKALINLRVHYTSLLNTAIAYGYEVDEDEPEE
jgi:hypothetical protein